jgi:hypothetical protein
MTLWKDQSVIAATQARVACLAHSESMLMPASAFGEMNGETRRF